MNIKEAQVAIDAILRAIDDDELPTPDKVERRDGSTIVWFGGMGRHIGTAKRNGAREPDIYRREGIHDAIQCEAVARIDAKDIAGATR